MPRGPVTKPTAKQIAQMKTQLVRLINEFGRVDISIMTSCDHATLRSWRLRGRISAKAAHTICEYEAVKNAGFTREILRPDVECWDV